MRIKAQIVPKKGPEYIVTQSSWLNMIVWMVKHAGEYKAVSAVEQSVCMIRQGRER